MLSPFFVMCSLLVAQEVSAVGLGEQTMYQDGALLDADFKQAEKPDSIFLQDISGNPIEADDDKFVELIKELHVDVVVANKDLAKMMSLASTKSRAAFLKHYEQYFKALDVGSVSRPMLLSYLGLEFTKQEELDSWYAPERGRTKDKVMRSCKKLLAERAQLHNANGQTDDKLMEMMKGDQMHKLHRVYLIFRNNLNLFMLENYLLLCSRLEAEKLSADLNESGFLLRKDAD